MHVARAMMALASPQLQASCSTVGEITTLPSSFPQAAMDNAVLTQGSMQTSEVSPPMLSTDASPPHSSNAMATPRGVSLEPMDAVISNAQQAVGKAAQESVSALEVALDAFLGPQPQTMADTFNSAPRSQTTALPTIDVSLYPSVTALLFMSMCVYV